MTQEALGRAVHTLEALVEYQDSSVVSRILLRKSAGSVTLFAFDAGQELSEHTTPYDALVQAVDGVIDITIDAQSYQLAKGDVLLMPANVPHAVHARERCKMLLTMIRQ